MDVLVLIGTIAAVVGGVAGIVAAIFAWRADQGTREAGRVADRRWTQQVRPRVVARIEAADRLYTDLPPDSIQLHMGNSGGAAADMYIMVHVGDSVYGTRCSVPEHIALVTYTVAKSGIVEMREGAPEILGCIAQDVAGVWWDMVSGRPLPDNEPPGPIGSTEFTAWWIDRVQAVARS